jgi:hypothetical protein
MSALRETRGVVVVRCLHCGHEGSLSRTALVRFGLDPNAPIAAYVPATIAVPRSKPRRAMPSTTRTACCAAMPRASRQRPSSWASGHCGGVRRTRHPRRRLIGEAPRNWSRIGRVQRQVLRLLAFRGLCRLAPAAGKFTVRVANPRRDEMMHLTLDASPFSHYEAQEVGQ